MITDSVSDDDDMQREIRNLFTRTRSAFWQVFYCGQNCTFQGLLYNH